ncbi:DsbA family protein [Bifidobacterium gallicum]|nr:thioredoxin domain-containing protein [Bifidobacterium gallicum]KFI60129.1 DSBA oxidoreductase [Bifidobacterium gallicum DSM 20093 = LMG 11596]
MAQNGKNTERRATRAERRAAEQAQRKAREEQAAKERKQQTIVGIVVAVVVIALLIVAGVAVYRNLHPADSQSSTSTASTKEEAYNALQNVSTKPKYADDQGGILMSKDGYGKKVADAPTIGIYMDFMCPGCGSLNRNLDQDLEKMMKAGQVNLDLHFMSFMDRFSTDEYSSRAANMALYVADHDDDPEHLLALMTNFYKSDFQPEEGSGYEPVSNKQLVEQVESAGIDHEIAEAAAQRGYDAWLSSVNTYTPMREELWNVSGSLKGSMTTPTVTINGHFWDMNTASASTASMTEAFLKAIGLPADKVGVAGVMPSIGANGAPLTGSDDTASSGDK